MRGAEGTNSPDIHAVPTITFEKLKKENLDAKFAGFLSMEREIRGAGQRRYCSTATNIFIASGPDIPLSGWNRFWESSGIHPKETIVSMAGR